MNQREIEEIRKEYPFLSDRSNRKIIYFDNAATTQKPQCVIDAMKQYYEFENANPHRGAHYLGMRATEVYETARQKVAEFISAKSSDEVIFVRNATEGLNLIAYSYALQTLKEGDEILISIMEHHSNLVPWQYVAQKTGATLNYIYLDEHFDFNLDEFEEKLNENTKIVSVTGASNTVATMPDISTIVQKAKEVGAITIIDGAQLVPHQKIDVETLNCDFLVFSGHKMYGPMGIGVLYAKKQLLEHMTPFLYGGDMIEYVYEQSTTFAPVPSKFEAGTQNVGGAVGLSAAIDYINRIGINNIASYERELSEYASNKIKQLEFITTYVSSRTHRSPLISFNIQDVHPHDVSTILDTDGIAIRTGHHCTMPLHRYLKLNATCRASFSIYNTKEEIDYFVQKLHEVRKVMGYES